MALSLIRLIAISAIALAAACSTVPPELGGPSPCELSPATAEPAIERTVQQKSAPDDLVYGLTRCLGDPDPVIRDDMAYLGLTRILRAPASDLDQRLWLLANLSVMLGPDPPDPDGYLKPFAALALSEVARTDRVEPWMTESQRDALVQTAANYLESVTDYRGFIDGEGWRHGVAHGADLLMQLSLNEAVGEADAKRMLDAIGAQIASHDAPAYIFDEPRRLSRPLLFLTQRGLLSEDELTAWFTQLADPAPLSSWDEAFKSEAALARRHNLRAFGYAVLVSATENEDENLKMLRPGALKLLTEIP